MRIRVPERRAALLASLCLAALVAPYGPARAQQPAAAAQQPPKPTFRTGVRVVSVDVSVAGRGQRPIEDLLPQDFEIEEDGVPQTVDTAQFIRRDGHRAAGNEDSLPIRSQEHAEAEAARDDVRVFAIFFDDYHVDRRPPITVPMRDMLQRFVDRLGPTDLVALMDPLTPLSALEFTRDLEAVRQRIKKLEGRQGELFPIRSALEEAQYQTRNVRMVRAEVTLSALAALVTRLSNLREGRKSVVLVSQGPFVFWGPDGNIEFRMREVLDAASRGNVNINVVDPRGLGGEGVGSRDTLMRLADETGGRSIVNTNAFNEMLGRVIEDASAYYLLSYTPTRAEDDGKFHRISVRVKRPGAKTIARRGYWAPKPGEVAEASAASAEPPMPGLSTALTPLAASKTGRPADVWVGVTPHEQGARLTVTWEPSASAPAGMGVPVSLDVERVTGPEARPVGEMVTVKSSAGVQGADAMAALDLPPGQATLRYTAKLPDGGTIDRWTQEIEVPDFARAPLVLGAAAFHRTRSPLEFRQLRTAGGAAPTASRLFRRAERVLVDVSVHGPVAGTATLTAELLNRAGQKLVDLAIPSATAGATSFELPVNGLANGTYVLRLTARTAEHSTERLEAFQMVP